MSDDYTIRRALPGDLKAIVALWEELQTAQADAEPRLTPNRDAAQWFRDFLRDQMDTPGMVVFVAEWDGAVVGYTFGQVMRRPTLASGDIGYIADLCVHDGFRGRGIGRALFHRLRSWFIGQGVRALEVQTVRANPAAQAFWRKMGFDDFLRTLRAEL